MDGESRSFVSILILNIASILTQNMPCPAYFIAVLLFFLGRRDRLGSRRSEQVF